MSAVIERLRHRGLLDLAKVVAEQHYCTLGQVCGRSRTLAVVTARHAVWAAVVAHARLSTTEAGDLFGVDHTTIMYGLRKARPRIDVANARAALRVV